MKKILKELVNLKENKRNKQISLDIRKTKLKKWGLEIKDIMDLKINTKKIMEEEEW